MRSRTDRGLTLARLHRGLALIEITLLALIVGGALVAGLITLKSRQASAAAESELAALTQADRYLVGFIAGHGRLPCPDTDNNGLENCGDGAQKGRLPYRTLGLEGSTAAVGTGSLSYMVQRSAAELTKIEPTVFEPVAWKDPNYNGRRDLKMQGTADFCQSLTNAAAVTPAAQQAHVGDAPTVSGYPVAYALAHPGQRQAGGTASSNFDGLNATSTVAMELPEKGSLLGSYDDRVVARTYQGLAQTLDCDRWRTALNTLSLAVSVIEEVESQRTSITLSAGILTTISGIKAIVFGVKTYGSASNLGVATTLLGTASGILSAAIASCVVLVGCFEIPHAAASVAAAAVAVAASVVGIALNVAAMAASIVAFGITTAAAVAAGNQVDASSISVTDATKGAKSAWTQSTKDSVDAKASLDVMTASLTAAATTKDAQWDALIATSHSIVDMANKSGTHPGTLALDLLDGGFVDLRTAADSWKKAQNIQLAAKADLKLAEDSAKNKNTDTSAGTQAAIKSLEDQLAKETDPKKQADLQAAIDRLKQPQSTASNAEQVTQLQSQISGIATQVASLNAQIDAMPAGAEGRNDLIYQRDALKQQSEDLTQQLKVLSLTVAQAESNLKKAGEEVATAYAALTKAYQYAIDQFKPENKRLPYTVCSQEQIVPTPKTGSTTREVCPSEPNRYLDGLRTYVGGGGPDPISPKVYGLFNTDTTTNNRGPNILFPSDIWVPPEGIGPQGAYFRWWDLTLRKVTAQTRYDDAVKKEASAKQSYDTLSTMTLTSPGGAGGGNAIWGAPIDMLKQIEQNGAIR